MSSDANCLWRQPLGSTESSRGRWGWPDECGVLTAGKPSCHLPREHLVRHLVSPPFQRSQLLTLACMSEHFGDGHRGVYHSVDFPVVEGRVMCPLVAEVDGLVEESA